jgi:hypothetical protein
MKEQWCWFELDDNAPTLNFKFIEEFDGMATTDLCKPCDPAMAQ